MLGACSPPRQGMGASLHPKMYLAAHGELPKAGTTMLAQPAWPAVPSACLQNLTQKPQQENSSIATPPELPQLGAAPITLPGGKQGVLPNPSTGAQGDL